MVAATARGSVVGEVARRSPEAIGKGIESRNRWVYLRHLRALRTKAADLAAYAQGVAGEFLARLDELERVTPDESSFPAEEAARSLREGAEAFRAVGLEFVAFAQFGFEDRALQFWEGRGGQTGLAAVETQQAHDFADGSHEAVFDA